MYYKHRDESNRVGMTLKPVRRTGRRVYYSCLEFHMDNADFSKGPFTQSWWLPDHSRFTEITKEEFMEKAKEALSAIVDVLEQGDCPDVL